MNTTKPNLPLRVRVAELLGTHKVEHDVACPFIRAGLETNYGTLITDSKGRYCFSGEFTGVSGNFTTHHPDFDFIPPYDTSRDAAMEAVHALLVTDANKADFIFHICEIKNTGWPDDFRECFALFAATPAEICEALLAALGKGVEGVKLVAGDRFLINGVEVTYCGQLCPYEGRTAPVVDVISIPSIILPSGKRITYAYPPGTWEHQITPTDPER